MESSVTATSSNDDIVQCKLTGFPSNLSWSNLYEYLPSSLVVVGRGDQSGQHQPQIHHHQNSTSVILELKSRQEFKELLGFVNGHKYDDRDVITCGKYQWNAKKQKKKKGNKTKKDKDANSKYKRESARSFLIFVQNREKNHRPSPLIKDDDENDSDFDPVIQQNGFDLSVEEGEEEEQFLLYTYTRDEVTKIYRTFKAESGNFEMISESMLMATLRRLRFIKTYKINHHQIMVVFQNRDGKFPSTEKRQMNPEMLERRLKRDERNQFDIVSISQVNNVTTDIGDADVPEQPPSMVMACIGEPPSIVSFEIKVEAKNVVLQDIEYGGPHGHILIPRNKDQKVRNKQLKANSIMKMEWTVPTPNKIGIWRARVHFKFQEFTIVRSIAISCGRRILQNALKPIAPYEKKKRTRRSKPQKSVRAPEKEQPPPRRRKDGKNTNKNPFKKLPHYTVPEEIADYLEVAKEFDHVMKNEMEWSHPSAFTDKEEKEDHANSSSIVGYGKYWSHLLWASEYQNWKDIELYDMENAQLGRRGRHYTLSVPGLAEKRPSVLRGDLVDVTLQDVLYQGRVVQIQQLDVYLEFDSRFSRKFDPLIDRVHVRFKFSRTTFRTSHHACQTMAESVLNSSLLMPTEDHIDYLQIQKNKKNGPADVGKIAVLSWANRSLNIEQKEAVQQIINPTLNPLPYIIFGPPGTGKTTTVVEAVYQLTKKQEKRVLVVAPSNDASDILVERLSTLFPPSELRRIIAYSRTVDSIPKSIRDYVNEAEHRDSNEQLQDILDAKIVVSTVNLAARFSYFGVPRNYFDVICVDEAGHCTEPEVIGVLASLLLTSNEPESDADDEKVAPNPDILHQQQIILAGDPKQLGPVTTSSVCEKFGLSVSYMERLSERSIYGRQEETGMYPQQLLTKLVQNYRTHPAILKLPNEIFYDIDLVCSADKMVTSNMTNWEHLPTKGVPLIFHSVLGSNCREAASPSWFNPQEAEQIIEYVEKLTKHSRPPLQPDEIGIITPYARQAQKIRKTLEVKGISDIKVGSVECFQGQERRVILLSTVRAEQDKVGEDLRYNLGFVANPRRFNVALTRAKALLIVVGSPSVLSMDKDHWFPFLKYCYEKKAWAGEDWDPSEVETGDECIVDFEGGIQEATNNIDNHSETIDPWLGKDFVFINREE